MLPATTSTPGTANASPVPSFSTWGLYNTREACEQDRQSMLSDPVLGVRIKEAKCAQAPVDQKTPLSLPTEYVRP
jgi:hypothetical protein